MHHHIVHVVGFFAFFLLGITTSIHCAGMCAPITILLFKHIHRTYLLGVYHVARILSYAFLGFSMGYVSYSLRPIVPFPVIFSLICIIFLIYIFDIKIPLPAFLQSRRFEFFQLARQRPWLRLFLFGFFTPLLPCAPLYMAFSASMAAPSPMISSLWMVFFGLGTVPLLFTAQVGLRFLSNTFFEKYQRVFFKVVSVATLLFVAWMVFFMHH